MDHKSFELGDPVWAKMKGFPAWPGKINVPLKPPFKKKHHHYVFFFGSENNAWILDENIVHHQQKFIDNYATKKTMHGLRTAINKITEYCEYLSSTSTSEEDRTSITEEDRTSITEEDRTSITDEKIASSEDAEISKSDPRKRTAEDLALEHRISEVPEKRIKSLTKVPRKRKKSFGTLTVRFTTSFQKRKSKPKGAPNYKSNMVTRKMVTRKRKRSESPDSVAKNEVQPSTPPRTYVTPTQKKIGFLGLGRNGVNIVRQLVKSGHNLTVFDRNVETVIERKVIMGVEMASSTKELILKCDIIISCAADINALNMFIFDPNDGIIAGLQDCNGTKGYVEMTSVGEKKAGEIAELIKQTGATFLEAPVNCPDSAETGDMYIFASGNVDLFNSCSTVFHAISSNAFYIGEEEGQGNALCSMSNSLVGVASAGLAETIAYNNYKGFSIVDMMSVTYYEGYGTDITMTQAVKILNGDFTCSSESLEQLHKDMQMTLKMANEVNQPMLVTAAANESLVYAKKLFHL